MATIDYIGDNGPDGIVVGKASTALVAFHGSTPTDQYATIAALTTGSTVATVETAVQAIIALLKEKGLCGT